MTTRLYLTNAAASFIPSTFKGTWNGAGGGGFHKMSKSKEGAVAVTSLAETSTIASWRGLMILFISEPFNNGGTFGGSFTQCQTVSESDGNANLGLAYHLYVTVGSTDVVRGTLATNISSATEWPTAGAALSSTLALSPVVVQAGDRVVYEMGYVANNVSAASYTGGLFYGGTGSDLKPGDNIYPINARPSWVQFTGADALFGPPVRGSLVVPVVTTPNPTISVPTAFKRGIGSVTTTPNPATTLPSAFKRSLVITTPSPTIEVTGSRLTSAEVLTETSPTVTPTASRISDPVEVETHTSPTVTPHGLIEGDIELPPPDVEVMTSPYRPAVRPGLRFIAQDAITGAILDWDLPISDVEISDKLSGPSLIKGVIAPENTYVRDLDLQAWGTYIHAEENGTIRASGLLQPGGVADGESRSVEAVGLADYPNDVIYLDSDISELQVDPLDITRRLWAHCLKWPDSPKGITVGTATSPIRLGEPAKVETDDNGSIKVDSNGVPQFSKPKPYEVKAINLTNCGSEINKLAQQTPFDYVERPRWNVDKTNVEHSIDLGYPRIGRLRDDLRFAQDENLTEVVLLAESPDYWASEVILKGNGTGAAGIYGYAAQRNARRIRRIVTVTDTSVYSAARAKALAESERLRRQEFLTIGKITAVADHDNAPLGSYGIGDDIVVQAEIPWYGEVALKHRIIGTTWRPDKNEVEIQLRRSEQFAYGQATSDQPAGGGTGGTTTGRRTANSPGELLDNGAGRKQNFYKLQTAFGSGGVVEKSIAEVGAGFSHNPEFMLNSARDAVIFRISMRAGTTSGSKYPRTEMREMTRSGGQMSTNFLTGEHWLQTTFKITHIQPQKPNVVVQQIHDASSDALQILTRKVGGRIKLMARINGNDNDAWVLVDNYSGQEVTCRIRTGSFSGHCEIYINGALKLKCGSGGVPALSPDGNCYFKYGVYPQSNSDTDSASEYASVEHRRVGTYHPGYPQPDLSEPVVSGGGVGGVVPQISMTFGACLNATDSGAFDVMRSLKPDYGVVLGDLVYNDGGLNSVNDFKSQWSAKFGAPKMGNFIRSLPNPLWYLWSDHDGTGASNGHAGAANTNANAAYRQLFTNVALPFSHGIHRSVDIGRIRFILTDERSFRTGSTVLGAGQKAWIKGLVATNAFPLIVILGDTPVVGPVTAGDDGWKGYNAERVEMGTAYANSPATVIRLNGDMHCLAIGHDQWGFDRVWQAAGFRQETKVKAKGEGYISTYPGNKQEGPVMEQFGYCVFADTGTQIVAAYAGVSGGQSRITDSITINR